jgi:hypothetical protein
VEPYRRTARRVLAVEMEAAVVRGAGEEWRRRIRAGCELRRRADG